MRSVKQCNPYLARFNPKPCLIFSRMFSFVKSSPICWIRRVVLAATVSRLESPRQRLRRTFQSLVRICAATVDDPARARFRMVSLNLTTSTGHDQARICRELAFSSSMPLLSFNTWKDRNRYYVSTQHSQQCSDPGDQNNFNNSCFLCTRSLWISRNW